MSIKIDGFRRAMKAALDGPSIKDVEWSSFGHDFNVKKVLVTRTSNGITIDGTDGHHISHRLKYRPDDQFYYKCRVTKDGKVEGLEVNIKTSWDVLEEWFKTGGEILSVIGLIAKADQVSALDPTPSSIELMDGKWKGDAEFLVANIIARVAEREMPELKTTPKPEFSLLTAVVHPTIMTRFHEAMERRAQQ